MKRTVKTAAVEIRERYCPSCGDTWDTTERETTGTRKPRLMPALIATNSIPVAAGQQSRAIPSRFGGIEGGNSGSDSGLFPVSNPEPSQQSGSGARARKGRKDKAEYSLEFLALWELARKQGKVGNKNPAFKSFDRLRADAQLNVLILTRYREWCQTDQWRRGYNPHLSTWLNQRGWEEPPTPADLRGSVNGNRGPAGQTRGQASLGALNEWLEEKGEKTA